MKKIKVLNYFPLLLIIVLPSLSKAQSNTDNQCFIAGRVVDQHNRPIGFATVTVLKSSDSSLVKNKITDEQGHYDFLVSGGGYLLSASMVGMTKAFSDPTNIKGGNSITIPDMTLKSNTNQLKGVQVTAGKPFIQHEIDKTVVNVENSIVSAGNTAWEILQKSPGVTVNNSSNAIQLQGKSGVVVYIDGKPTHLSQDQLANMLKNMSSESIKSIEIMTQPSAKYDAAGNAGIINIVTRKSERVGFNGSITAAFRQGKYARENGGVNLNYRNGKINLYSSYDYTHAKWWNDNYITRNFYKGDPKSLDTRSEQYSSHVSPGNSHDFKAGMDYYLDDKNTLGLMVNGSYNLSNDVRKTNTDFKSSGGSLQYNSVSRNTDISKWNNFTYDLNYQGRYDSTGREMDIDIAYSRFESADLPHFITNTYYPDHTPFPDGGEDTNPNIRKGSLPSVIDIKTGKIDYTLPLKKKMKFDFGAKMSFVTSDNDVQYHQMDNETGSWIKDSTSNHFNYKENINAAYFNFNKEFEKGWGLQLGFRGEQTISKGYQYVNDSTVKRNYFQLFPSVFVSKKLDKNNNLNLSYSRRIDRPDYQSLNPFRYYLDPYTYGEGNPFLQPQLTHSVKMSYSYKTWLTTAISYSRTDNVMTQVLEQDDSSLTTYQTERNLSKMKNLGLEITLAIPVTKWWMSNNYINIFENVYQGQFLGSYLNFSRTTYLLHSTNTFILPKGFKAELTGFYHSSAQWSIFSVEPQYAVSAGIEKSIMHDKADIKLNVNDLFNTQRSYASVKYQNLDVTAKNHWDSRYISLTFTYRFHKGNTKPARQHQSAIEAEQSRIKK